MQQGEHILESGAEKESQDLEWRKPETSLEKPSSSYSSYRKET